MLATVTRAYLQVTRIFLSAIRLLLFPSSVTRMTDAHSILFRSAFHHAVLSAFTPVRWSTAWARSIVAASRNRGLTEALSHVSAQQAANRLRQLVRISRFCYVFLIAGFERTLPVGITRVRCKRNRRCESTVVERTSPDFTNEAVTVFTRHRNVGHENVRPELVQSAECFSSRSRSAYRCTLLC